MARASASTDDATAQRYLANGWELCKAKLGYSRAKGRRRGADDELKDFPLLGTIGPSDVVGDGDTTGGFYRRWTSKGRYLADLARYIVDNGRFAGGGPEQRGRDLVMALGDAEGLGALVSAAARSEIEQLVEDPTFAFQLQMWSIRRRYRWVHESLRTTYAEVSDEWSEVYDLVFRLYGWRLRPGWDSKRLAIAIMGLVDGLAIRRGLDPEAVDDELFPEALLGLLLGLSIHPSETEARTIVEAFEEASRFNARHGLGAVVAAPED